MRSEVAERGLHVDRVSVHFGAVAAVESVSLRLAPGTVLAVLGPSGCGKSTLLRAVAGLEPLSAGSVRFDGRDLAGVPTHRRGFAMMFQDGQLFLHADVAGNVGYALRLAGLRGAALRREVDRLLHLVDLDGYAARRPATLSGGEQQRVALARALAARPRLLLLDEPLSALDRALRDRLAVDLRGVLTATGTTALLVTHDHDEAFTVADRMAVMRSGRIVQEGPTAAVWRAPADAETARFLGYATVLDGAAAATLAAYLPAPAGGGQTGTGVETFGRAGAGPAAGGQPVGGGQPSPSLAVRRWALRTNPAGVLHGRVTGWSAARDGMHLQVEVTGLGSVAALGEVGERWAEGEQVRLAIDPAGVAALP